MELDVGERGVLLSLLPKEGSFDNLKVMHELRMQLSFSELERDEIKFSTHDTPQGGLQTRWENNVVKDVPITKSAARVVEDTLLELNKRKKLPSEALSLYEKFIDDA